MRCVRVMVVLGTVSLCSAADLKRLPPNTWVEIQVHNRTTGLASYDRFDDLGFTGGREWRVSEQVDES